MSMRKYEMMLLFDTNEMTKGWEEYEQLVKGALDKYGASVTSLEKWGDRKLAYEINKLRRATYMLVFFEMDSNKVPELDRDFRLNEKVLRHMIIKDEKVDIDPETLRRMREEQEENLEAMSVD